MWLLLLLLLLSTTSIVPVATLLNCSSCQLDVDVDNQMRCDADCQGDFCYQSTFYYDDDKFVFSNAGCIVGDVTAVGCRANQDGQIMCICQEDYCNFNVSLATNTTISRLATQICEKTTNDGINSVRRWEKPCAGNMCIYRKHIYDFDNDTRSSKVIDCTQENDFDVFSSNPIFFYYPNNCVRLEYIGQPSDISCYGDLIDYSTLHFPDETIECYMDYYSPVLPYERSINTCMGQMCFISSNIRGDVQRGCVSFADGLTGTVMEPSYYRDQVRTEEWLCRSNRCNFDLYAAENSWDDSKAQYKNISRLQQWNIFYIINGGILPQTPWFFLLFVLLF